MPELLCGGYGYVAARLAPRLIAQGWQLVGTARDPAKHAPMIAAGVEALSPGPQLAPAVLRATHLLLSAPPGDGGDPILAAIRDLATPCLSWIGYLSTTGVYGDHGGRWVTEDSALNPQSARSQRRAAAEMSWVQWGAARGAVVQIFRLAGIYGPGRSPFDALRAGTARRIAKPGQVFSRIHVDDIAQAVVCGIAHPRVSGVFNVCDDEPAAPADVVAYAAQLLGMTPPPLEDYDMARATMSAMSLSFYADNKRVANAKIKAGLGVRLAYPTYREGLKAVLAEE